MSASYVGISGGPPWIVDAGSIYEVVNGEWGVDGCNGRNMPRVLASGHGGKSIGYGVHLSVARGEGNTVRRASSVRGGTLSDLCLSTDAREKQGGVSGAGRVGSSVAVSMQGAF